MDNLKLKQLAISELKIESVTDFCLHTYGNDVVLWGHCSEFHILEMLYSVDLLIPLPFRLAQVQMTQKKPLTHLIKDIDLVSIYSDCDVLESQDLSMDPIYVYDCSVEPVKPRLLHAELLGNDCQMCCMLTTYGACEMAQRDACTNEWRLVKTNLNKIFIAEIFPITKSPSDIKTFKQFKHFIDNYVITHFTWSPRAEENVIYVSVASGYVVALSYLPDERQFKERFKLKTSLDRIVYMEAKDHLLLVASAMGEVLLLNIGPHALTHIDYLWNKKDRMACRHAVINYSEQWSAYVIIYCKGAHILAYLCSTEGHIMANSTLYLKGIKISGLASISPHEYVTTSIMSTVTYIRLSRPTPQELCLEPQLIEHDMDSTNLQILGIALSKSRNLWTFLLSRNKDYTHHSKISQNATFISVSKINTVDSLNSLININLTTMDAAQDLLIAINLDIINNLDTEKYVEFLGVSRLVCPKVLNDVMLQKLQIKLLILRFIAKYQKMKYKSYKRNTEEEFLFLEAIVQLVYILDRLQYLQIAFTLDVKLSPFQQLSVVCMQSQFTRLLTSMSNNENDDNPLRNAMDHFVNVLGELYNKCKFVTNDFRYNPETCWLCQAEISVITFDKCPEGHEVKRCTISYTQLPLFQTKYCPHCFALANGTAETLQELFPANEIIKCTFCRFLLKEDNL
ncbi:uncharacterized protein LOC106090444 isoform X1 [Stomoxys calcitrans]|uniref:uncharacterized protein LOC106090444 isoform X1 n=2 Tax=Stomoxys calcitrans TaxID=35570 RepID=UPI0027E241DF|nr:uncharacterized protein LOC106090444 isoform X1 [Stomoxys calcitrans]